MPERDSYSLTAHAGWRVLEGFGAATRVASRFVEPSTDEELAAVLESARREGISVTFRGSGQSYGDAALNTGGLVVDLRGLRDVRRWDPADGIIECGPGLTIGDLWQRTLEDGFWPHVVPGTMRPTLGGCLSTNIHGKNNYKAGTFGDHVLDFDLVTPRGERVRCSRTENADVFFSAIGGLGLLGAVTRVRLELKRVESGLLKVQSATGHDLDAVLDQFEQLLPIHDYVVGWIDGTARGAGLGRGELHGASYLGAADVENAAATLKVEHQTLPDNILGLPKSLLWRFMRPLMFDSGVRMVNSLKYASASRGNGSTYTQSHVAFAFLLDYVPNWRLAYGTSGFIQHQVFVPHADVRRTLRAVLARCHDRGLPPYLAVLKRHRPDDFLLSHAVDGWSLAMDFPVPAHRREELWRLADELTAIVLDAGGRFYFAKDSVLKFDDVLRFFGADAVERFMAIKSRLDPDGVLSSDLWRRITRDTN